MSGQLGDGRKNFSTIVALRQLWRITMENCYVISVSRNGFKTLPTYSTLPCQSSMGIRNVFMKIFLHLKFLTANIANIFLWLVVIIYMNAVLLSVGACLEAIFALQSIPTLFLEWFYISFKWRAYEKISIK